MFLILQTIVFSLMSGCSKPAMMPVTNNNNPVMDTTDTTDTLSNNNQLTWLALGDSYTIGESVSENERFPAQTISILRTDKLAFYEPQYIATTGWTCQNLLDAILQQNPQGPFDVVSLLIGVNDQYQRHDTMNYRAQFTECLQKAISFAKDKQHVFVVSIPDYSVTPFAAGRDTAEIRKQIDEFNTINKEITLSYNISYTYITDLTREAKTDASLIAPDGLHPSGKEYANWADMLAPEIAKVLK